MTNPKPVRVVLIALLALLCGCQSTQPREDSAGANGTGDALKEHPLRTDVPATSATAIFPLSENAVTFAYVEGPRRGQPFVSTIRKDGGAKWRQVEEGIRTTFLEAKDGALFITREEDLEENVIVEYAPPLELLPASLSVGQPRETRCQMTVRNRDTGAIREEGECVHRVEYLGRRIMTAPGGQIDACLTRSTRQMQLKLAKVNVQISAAAAPGRGQIWSRAERATQALGLFTVRRSEEIRLQSWTP